MGAVYKTLSTIRVVTDTDVGYYDMGEVSGTFGKDDLRNHIKSYGSEGLLKQLAYMQYQVWKMQLAINGELVNEQVNKGSNKK